MITEFQDGFVTKTKLNELVGGINDINSKIMMLTDNITKTVGAGGDFTTLNLAISWCKKIFPNGYKVTLQLMTGFIMAEQILLENVNLGFITISSVDSEVIVNKSNISIGVVILDGYSETYPIFYGLNSELPIINSIFNMNGTVTDSNMVGLGVNNCRCIINKTKGFKNISGRGILALNSDIIADGFIISSYSKTIDSYGSKIRASSSSLTTLSNLNITAASSSILNIRNSSIYGGSVYKIASQSNSNVCAVSLTNVGEAVKVSVYEGSILSIGNTANVSLSQTANTTTANGIIFQ